MGAFAAMWPWWWLGLGKWVMLVGRCMVEVTEGTQQCR